MRTTVLEEKHSVWDSPSSEPKGAVTSASTAPSRTGRSIVTLNDIWVRAYSKWQTAGCPDGDGSRFWLEAEQELLHGK